MCVCARVRAPAVVSTDPQISSRGVGRVVLNSDFIGLVFIYAMIQYKLGRGLCSTVIQGPNPFPQGLQRPGILPDLARSREEGEMSRNEMFYNLADRRERGAGKVTFV